MTDGDLPERPGVVLSLTLYLLRGVSQFRVFQAIAQKYPTEAALQELCNSDMFLELIDDVGEIFNQLHQIIVIDGDLLSAEEQANEVLTKFPEAKARVGDLAELLGVDETDLLSVLMMGWQPE